MRFSEGEQLVEDSGSRQNAGWFGFHFDGDRWERTADQRIAGPA